MGNSFAAFQRYGVAAICLALWPPEYANATSQPSTQLAQASKSKYDGVLIGTLSSNDRNCGFEGDKKPYGNGDGNVTYKELGKYLEGTMTYFAMRYYGRDQNAQIVNGG